MGANVNAPRGQVGTAVEAARANKDKIADLLLRYGAEDPPALEAPESEYRFE